MSLKDLMKKCGFGPCHYVSVSGFSKDEKVKITHTKSDDFLLFICVCLIKIISRQKFHILQMDIFEQSRYTRIAMIFLA